MLRYWPAFYPFSGIKWHEEHAVQEWTLHWNSTVLLQRTELEGTYINKHMYYIWTIFSGN